MGLESNIEILKEYAYRTKRNIIYNEEQYSLSIYRKIPRFKQSVIIPNNSDNSSYFVLFADPYYKIGDYTAFCGVYIPIKTPLNTLLNLREKNILDRLNPFLSKKSLFTGDYNFDSKVVSSGNDYSIFNQLFNDRSLQNLILDTFRIKSLHYFSINETNVDFVPELKGKSHFCIYNPQEWILDESIFEKWFEVIEKVREILINKNLV